MEQKCSDKRLGQLIGLYELGALDEKERRRFQDHFIACDYCYQQVYSLEPVMNAFRAHRNAAMSEDANGFERTIGVRALISEVRPRSRSPLPALAALVVVLIVGTWLFYTSFFSHRIDSPVQVASARWDDIGIPRAPYTRPKEGTVLRGSEALFDRAMASYEAGDYSKAIEQLDTLRETSPETIPPGANFYLGVSLLLASRAEEAISPLRRVIESGDGTKLEASHFYLGLGYLKHDQPGQAQAEFDTVIGMKGQYQSDAENLNQIIAKRLH